MIDIEAIAQAGKALDNANVPVKGRIMRFIGKDGNEYEIQLDKPITEDIYKQIPDSLIRNVGNG